ncbi:MAG TPA: hypothetical protein VGP26_23020 [Actinophytocola sp.]|jgi:hypothetical protein|nr:hypothetical protein [Actinophytocola sp.]
MPSLKRLVSVVAFALFVLLGALSNAAADVSADQPGTAPAAPTATGAPGGPSAGAGEQPLLPAPGPPPVRHKDPLPDSGPPFWLWIVLGLAAGTGVWLAVVWVRGSRSPANAEPLLESTAELIAVGRRQSPLVTRHPGHIRQPGQASRSKNQGQPSRGRHKS